MSQFNRRNHKIITH